MESTAGSAQPDRRSQPHGVVGVQGAREAVSGDDPRGVRLPVAVDVSSTVGGDAPCAMRGWVRVPSPERARARPVVLACLAGGSCSTDYFDLTVDGHADTSMAAYLAARGFAVAALDHPGVGASDPVADVFALTPTVVAAAHARAWREVIGGIEGLDGAPFVVGVGHSMGGMLATVAQARHRPFDALVGLGHGGDGLPEHLEREELELAHRPLEEVEAEIVARARRRFAVPSPIERRRAPPNSFFAPDVPFAIRRAFAAQQAQLLYTCGLTSMIPGSTDREKAAIDVPLFLGFGDQDLTRDFAGSVAKYTGCRDATLYVLSDAAHCHNQARTRVRLWDRLARWIEVIVDRADCDPG